jgi:hypothetical protein
MIRCFSTSQTQRSSLHQGAGGDRDGGDSRRWLRRQLKFELLDQKLELGLGLGIAGQPELPPIGRRQMNIDHLDGGEFLQSAACGQPGAKACKRRCNATCMQYARNAMKI